MPYLDILTKFIDSKNNVIPSCKPQRWGVKKVSVFFTRLFRFIVANNVVSKLVLWAGCI